MDMHIQSEQETIKFGAQTSGAVTDQGDFQAMEQQMLQEFK